MRHTSTFGILLTALIFISFLSSCKKENGDNSNQDNNPNNTDTTGNQGSPADSVYMLFTASVNGSGFEADTNMITHEFDEGLNLHVITAPDGEGHVITIMLASLDPGTYEVDFDNSIVTYQNGLTVYSGGFNPEGQIVITHHENNTISGTFHASLFDFGTAQDAEVTNGHFIKIPVN